MRRFVRTSLYALDALLVLLFLAGYAAYFVRPTVFWWFELVAVFLPYLSAAVLLTCLMLLGLRRWPLALLHGLLLLLVVVRMNPLDRFVYEPSASGDTLSVLTFNVPRWWGYEMSAKTTRMGELMQQVKPDVIGLQEADIAYFNEAPRLRAAPYVAVLYDSLGYATMRPHGRIPTYTPQPVLSKQRIVRQSTYELVEASGDTSQTTVTRTQIRWNGRDFALYNVHLRTFGEKKPWQEDDLPFLEPSNLLPYFRQYADAYRIRAWEIDEILKMVGREDIPVVLSGDFNSTPNNWVHGRVTRELRDAFAEKGSGWGMTYHTRLPVVRIDYVFVSDDWEVVSARVVDAYLSDHLPLLVELKLK